MLYVQQIRKIIYDILTYYYEKENKIQKQKQYCNYNLNEYQNEFECLINEKRLGIYTNLNKKDALICLKLFEMLYERNYILLLNIYYMKESKQSEDSKDNIEAKRKNYMKESKQSEDSVRSMERNASGGRSKDDIKSWINVLKTYFDTIKLNRYKIIPEPLKNYKAKKPQKFYQINDIINNL